MFWLDYPAWIKAKTIYFSSDQHEFEHSTRFCSDRSDRLVRDTQQQVIGVRNQLCVCLGNLSKQFIHYDHKKARAFLWTLCTTFVSLFGRSWFASLYTSVALVVWYDEFRQIWRDAKLVQKLHKTIVAKVVERSGDVKWQKQWVFSQRVLYFMVFITSVKASSVGFPFVNPYWFLRQCPADYICLKMQSINSFSVHFLQSVAEWLVEKLGCRLYIVEPWLPLGTFLDWVFFWINGVFVYIFRLLFGITFKTWPWNTIMCQLNSTLIDEINYCKFNYLAKLLKKTCY